MKKYKICVEKKERLFDTIEVMASCPMEAKRIAKGIAVKQERDLTDNKVIEFEGKSYPKFRWSESERPTYLTEIITD